MAKKTPAITLRRGSYLIFITPEATDILKLKNIREELIEDVDVDPARGTISDSYSPVASSPAQINQEVAIDVDLIPRASEDD